MNDRMLSLILEDGQPRLYLSRPLPESDISDFAEYQLRDPEHSLIKLWRCEEISLKTLREDRDE